MKAFIARHKTDIIVISTIVIIALFVILITLLSRSEGGYVKVTKDGEVVAILQLGADNEYSVDGKNTVVIEDGKAYMKYADCPDGLCEKMGKIYSVGERIICLPNRVVVEVCD